MLIYLRMRVQLEGESRELGIALPRRSTTLRLSAAVGLCDGELVGFGVKGFLFIDE